MTNHLNWQKLFKIDAQNMTSGQINFPGSVISTFGPIEMQRAAKKKGANQKLIKVALLIADPPHAISNPLQNPPLS